MKWLSLPLVLFIGACAVLPQPTMEELMKYQRCEYEAMKAVPYQETSEDYFARTRLIDRCMLLD